MTMAYDNTTSGTDPNAITKTLAHTGTGNQLAAIAWLYTGVGIPGEGSCTYGGLDMTPIAYKQQTNQDIHMWARGNVSAGAKNVIAAWTTYRACVMGVMTFSGAHISANPIRASATSGGVGTNVHLSDTIASGIGEFCIDAMAGGQGGEALTPDGGQTEVYDLQSGAGIQGAASYKAASAISTAMGYTTGGSTQNAVHIAATIKMPSGGSQVIVMMFKQWTDLYDRLRRGLALPEWYLRRDRPAWAAAYKSALRGC